MLFGIRMIPYGTRYIGEASTSIKKIQEILLFPKYETQLSVPNAANMAVTLKNSTFSWDVDSLIKASKTDKLKSNGIKKEPIIVDNGEEVPLKELTNEEKKQIYCLRNLNLSIEKVIFIYVLSKICNNIRI